MSANNDPLTKPEKIKHAVLKLARHILAVLRRTLWNGPGEWHLKKSEQQKIKQWTRFDTYVFQNASGLSKEDFYHKGLFDEALKKSKNVKFWEITLRVSSWITLSLCACLILWLPSNYSRFAPWTVILVATSILFMTLTEISFKKRRDLRPEELVEAIKVTDKAKAQKFLDTLETKILPRHRFAVKDKMGNFQELPSTFTRAEYILLFLFGEEKHRQAIPLLGKYPVGDLYISVSGKTRFRRTKNGELLEFISNKARVKKFCNYVRAHKGRDPEGNGKLLSKLRRTYLQELEFLLKDFDLWLRIKNRNASADERNEFESEIRVIISQNHRPDKVADAYVNFTSGKTRYVYDWIQAVEERMKIIN